MRGTFSNVLILQLEMMYKRSELQVVRQTNTADNSWAVFFFFLLKRAKHQKTFFQHRGS